MKSGDNVLPPEAEEFVWPSMVTRAAIRHCSGACFAAHLRDPASASALSACARRASNPWGGEASANALPDIQRDARMKLATRTANATTTSYLEPLSSEPSERACTRRM